MKFDATNKIMINAALNSDPVTQWLSLPVLLKMLWKYRKFQALKQQQYLPEPNYRF